MIRRGAFLAALLALGILPAAGQEQGAPPPQSLQQGVTVLPSPILTIDQDALFSRSVFGRRVRQELEEASRRLAAENRQMETSLAAEERSLTELRATLPVEEFRIRAAAFDKRVEQIRDEQDTKARAINRTAEQERKRFFDTALPILKTLIAELGAVAIVDVRAIVLSAQSIDVTDTAVGRLDAVLGEGEEPDPGEEPAAPAQPAAP